MRRASELYSRDDGRQWDGVVVGIDVAMVVIVGSDEEHGLGEEEDSDKGLQKEMSRVSKLRPLTFMANNDRSELA